MEVSKWRLSSSIMRCCFVYVLYVHFVLISGAPDGSKSCGGDIIVNRTALLLSSPGYSSPSKSGITCTWIVRARGDHRVFVQGVNLNVGSELKDCKKGSLQIFDGCDSDRFLVEEICSSRYKVVDHDQGFLWLSSTPCITVKYSSGSGSNNKFDISVMETSVTCGGVLRNRNSNHSFGGSLPFDTKIRECVWIIAVQKGKIELVFTKEFSVPSRGQDCKEDFVRVQDGRYSSSPLLGTYCGRSRPYPVYSSGSYLRVTLHGSKRRLATGHSFDAVYNVVDSKPKPPTGICDGDIDLPSQGGKFQTPRYFEQYPAGLRCIWKIKVAENYKITLKFQHFDVEGDSQECPDNSDYAKVQDGLASWSPIIGRYCGSEPPSAITSKSNKLRVEFKSNSQYAGRGFDAVYTVDGGTQDLETRNHFTGIMIGSTCGIIFIVLSILAVFHTRKLRFQRALSRRSDVASTISLDGHQANAPPSYETVMASPDLFPSNSRQQSRGYSSVPHLHREISHLLGAEAESDDEELPPYPGLPHRDGIVEFLPGRPSRERRISSSEKRHDSESDNPFQISAVWYRRWPTSASSSFNVGHDVEGSINQGRTLERRESGKERTRPGLQRLDTTSSFVTDV